MTLDSLTQLASSGLPSLGGSYDNHTWKRSMGELQASSDSLWTHNSNSTTNNTRSTNSNPSGAYGSPMPPANYATSTPLLAAKRLPDLGRTATQSNDNANASMQSTQQAETDFLQWEEANRREEVDILSRMVQTAEATTRRRSQDLFEKKMEEDWEKTLDLWTKEVVGSRTLGGSALEQNGNGNGRSNNGGFDNSANSTNTPLITSGFQDPVASVVLMGGMVDRRVDPASVRSHSNVVQQLKQKTTMTDHRASLADLNVATNEIRLLADLFDSPGSSAYSSALQIVAGILSRPNASPLEVALATLGFYSRQFESHIFDKVRSAGTDGQAGTGSTATYNNANATTVATYVSIELGSTGEASFWACLFYCLRIGDAVAAKEIFEVNAIADGTDETNAAIGTLLSSLAQRQGAGGSFWQIPGPLTLPSDEVRNIAEACEIAKAAEQQDMHRIGLFSLLSGAGVFLTSTIEDYLFGLLWKALQSSSPVVELENLGREIRNHGSAYFADEVSGGWSYALPLFATQQYRAALTYLMQAGGATGLMQATHLGMLLSPSDVTVDNLGDPEPQSSSGLLVTSLVTSLLVEYANFLHSDQNFGALFSLEYLLWIPNKHVMITEVVSLILRADNFCDLTGALIREDGKRGKGVLDNYFSAQAVSMLLKQAAERCMKDAKDTSRQTRGGTLFMLSGDYRSVITMMSRLMDPGTKNNDAGKHFWYGQARQFDSLYLAKSTRVTEALQGDWEAVTTLRALMQLFDFFELMSKGRSAEAWVILNGLNILPSNHSDITKSDVDLKGADLLLQKVVPSVLETAMRSLYQDHAQLKRNMHLARATTIDALAQLKEKARVLISFAGIISDVQQATIEEMARLEAHMI